jgi:hypothetical protein
MSLIAGSTQAKPVAARSRKKARVLASPRQSTRHPRVTQDGLLTVAVFRPWRGSQCPAAQDQAPDEAMQTHELRSSDQ